MTLFSNSSIWPKEEHKIFTESIKRFYQLELVPNIESWNSNGVVDRSFWFKAGAEGIMGGSVPEKFGGSGGDLGFDSIALYEQA